MFMPPVFPAHWHVSQPVLIADTFSSLVWKVSLPDGTPAIVKGLKPIEDIADRVGSLTAAACHGLQLPL